MIPVNDTIFGELLYSEEHRGEFNLDEILAKAKASGKHDLFTCWHDPEWLHRPEEKRHRTDMHPVLAVIPIDEELERTLKFWIENHGTPMLAIACNWEDFHTNPAYSD